MTASLSDSSIKQYDTSLKKWFHFAHQSSIDPYEASITNIIMFLTHLFESGAQYSTLNSCRSALSLIFGKNVGSDDRIQRFLKGVFKLRPPLPRYDVTWDTSLVLNTLAGWYPNENLPFDKLTKKLCTLLALVTAHRAQTLSKINIKNIATNSSEIIIKITDLIKTSRPGSSQPTLCLPFFLDKPEICPAKTLTMFLEKTKDLRTSHEYLFISIKKPHKKVTAQTISRWIKSTLANSGIDVTIFSGHSTRHASTSKAFGAGVSLDIIRKTAGWGPNSSVFARFYNRVIINQNDQNDFARSIINNKV